MTNNLSKLKAEELGKMLMHGTADQRNMAETEVKNRNTTRQYCIGLALGWKFRGGSVMSGQKQR